MAAVSVNTVLIPAFVEAGIQAEIHQLPVLAGSKAITIKPDAPQMTNNGAKVIIPVMGQLRALSTYPASGGTRSDAYADASLSGVNVEATVTEVANKIPIAKRDLDSMIASGLNPSTQVAQNVLWAFAETAGKALLTLVVAAIGTSGALITTASTALTLKFSEIEAALNKFGREANQVDGNDVCLMLMPGAYLAQLETLQADNGSPLNLITQVQMPGINPATGMPRVKKMYRGMIEVQAADEMTMTGYDLIAFLRAGSGIIYMPPSPVIDVQPDNARIGEVILVNGAFAPHIYATHPNGTKPGISFLRVPKS